MSKKERIYSIDFLKIVCTILILFHHYQQTTGLKFDNCINFFDGKVYFGYIVEFFFIISGLFMFRYEEKIGEQMSYKHYIINKVKRFLPLMCIAAVAYTLLLVYYTKVMGFNYFGYQPTLWGTIVSSLGIQNGGVFRDYMVNYPTWYISVLFICYTIYYFLVKISKKKNISIDALVLTMILIGIGLYNYKIDFPFLIENCARGYYSFFLGILLGKYIYKENKLINIETIIFSIVSIVSIILFTIFYYPFVENGYNFILTFMLYPSIIILLNSKNVKKLFQLKFIEVLSKISFDVYIWHSPLYIIMFIMLNKNIIKFNILTFQSMVFYTIVCYILGTLSYYFIDIPIQSRLNKEK